MTVSLEEFAKDLDPITSKNHEPGIYLIYNSESSKGYVGQSIDIRERMTHHLSHLRLKKHRNDHIQNSFNKYGRDAFKFLVLEKLGENADILTRREQYYMDKLDVINSGYNIRPRADSKEVAEETKEKISKLWDDGVYSCARRGDLASEETKKKLSDSHADISGKNNPCSREVRMVDADGEIVKSFNTVTKAAKYVGGSVGSISLAASGKMHTSYGWRWEYANPNSGRRVIKKVIMLDKESLEEIREFGSTNDAADYIRGLGLTESTHVSAVINGVLDDMSKSAYGYRWKIGELDEGEYSTTSRVHNAKKVYMWSLDGEFIRAFGSCREAGRYLYDTGKTKSELSGATNVSISARKDCGHRYSYQWSYSKESPGKANTRMVKVNMLDDSYNILMQFSSMKNAGEYMRKIGKTTSEHANSSIKSALVNPNQEHAYGYRWEYA